MYRCLVIYHLCISNCYYFLSIINIFIRKVKELRWNAKCNSRTSFLDGWFHKPHKFASGHLQDRRCFSPKPRASKRAGTTQASKFSYTLSDIVPGKELNSAPVTRNGEKRYNTSGRENSFIDLTSFPRKYLKYFATTYH